MDKKMNYIIGARTDVGTRKKTNQDAVAIKAAKCNYGEIVMGIICDGLGGLSSGEVASSHVLKKFTEWFELVLPTILGKKDFDEIVRSQWTQMVVLANDRLSEYGSEREISLGTTISAILLFNGKYYIVHVGDSRIYQISNDGLTQMTNDHSFVAREVALGHLTPEQARVDKRRNVLLQCVGATPRIEPDFLSGKLPKEAVYMFCSDGFRNKLTEEEISEGFRPRNLTSAEVVNNRCALLIDTVKLRHETDNITAGVIKIF